MARACLLAGVGWQLALAAMPSLAQSTSSDSSTALGSQASTSSAAGQLQATAAAQSQAASALSQTPGGLRIKPVLDVGVNVVNSSLDTGQGLVYERSGDVVTQLRPGLQMTGRLGRSYGSLYYALDIRRHSRPLPGQAEADRLKNALNGTLSSELVEHWIYLDASASISQQAISAYGQQSIDNGTYNPNRTEVTQISVRPYSRGSVAGLADYELSFTADTVHVKNSSLPDSRGTGASLALGSPNSGALFGWGALLTQQHSTFSGGQATDSGRVSLSLLVRPNSELQGSLRGGQETTKITGVYDATYTNYGGDLRWTPSPRTTALISADERYFGRAYQVAFEHRLSRSSIRFTSSRDVSSSANSTGVGAPVTLYQLFYNQFASVQPDPVLREQLVRDFLASIGQDPNSIVSGGFVNAGVTLQRREDLALSYTGIRTTFALQAYSSLVSQLASPNSVTTFAPARQFGLAASLNYRLTPERNASLLLSRLQTQGTDTQAGNHLNSVTLNVSDRLGRITTAAINARYSVFEGPINPYHETSLGVTVSLRF